MEKKSILTQQQQAALAKGRREREKSSALSRQIIAGEITLEEAMKIQGIPYDPTSPSSEERAEMIRAHNAGIAAVNTWRASQPPEKTNPETEWYAKIGKGVVILIGFLIAILVTIWRFAD